MAIIWFIFIIFPCHCAVYMYKIMILQKPLSQYSSSKLRTAQMMIFSLVAMLGLEKCCTTSACLQWLCHSGERTVARGPRFFFVFFFFCGCGVGFIQYSFTGKI